MRPQKEYRRLYQMPMPMQKLMFLSLMLWPKTMMREKMVLMVSKVEWTLGRSDQVQRVSSHQDVQCR